jgi:hypothetical protein
MSSKIDGHYNLAEVIMVLLLLVLVRRHRKRNFSDQLHSTVCIGRVRVREGEGETRRSK